MKILCFLLSIISALLGGVLAYTVEAGRLPMQDMKKEEGTAEEQEEQKAKHPIISSQIGLVDELVDSLQSAHMEMDDARLRLDKREKNLQELYASYLKLRQETELLISDLETRLVKVDAEEFKNFKKLSSVYSNMEPRSAAESLNHMEAERVALILSQMDSRAMAAIMDEAVSISVEGSEKVAEWSDAVRRLNESEKKEIL